MGSERNPTSDNVIGRASCKITTMAKNEGLNEYQKSSERLEIDQINLKTLINPVVWNLFYKQDEHGNTELHKILSNPLPDEGMVVKMINLSPNNCLLNTLNNNEETPLHVAIKFRSYKAVRILSLHGADPRIKNKWGNSALHAICLLGDVKLLRALIDPPNSNDLHHYYQKPWSYSLNIMTLCLEQLSFYGHTPLHAAVNFNNVKMARMLLHYGSDVNARTFTCALSPLHISVLNNNRQMVKLLLDRQANVNVRTHCTMSVYDVACNADPIIRQMLLDAGAIRTLAEYSDDDSESDYELNILNDLFERTSG